jgi:hypothetical protein
LLFAGGVKHIYLELGTLAEVTALITALIAISAQARKMYLWFERQERQNAEQWNAINRSRREQTLICYGVKACLEGLVEQGCDGPCRDALDRLEKHLNKAAHESAAEEK